MIHLQFKDNCWEIVDIFFLRERNSLEHIIDGEHLDYSDSPFYLLLVITNYNHHSIRERERERESSMPSSRFCGKLTPRYIKNNLPSFTFFVTFLLINALLIIARFCSYSEYPLSAKIAKSCGEYGIL